MAKKVGRPSLYKSEYCERLLESAKKGETVIEFCGDLGISKDTFYEWIKQHEEFSDAKKGAEQLREQWWVRFGKAMMAGKVKNGNSTIYIWLTKNLFKWRDRQDVSNEDGTLQPTFVFKTVKNAKDD